MSPSAPRSLLLSLARWLLVAAAVGLLAGSLTAAFLVSLDAVTAYREAHPRIIFLLPLAGLFLGWIYDRLGRGIASGHNLLLDEIHEPRNAIPLRMAPLVLFGTLLTHLFGGSAGREGTAVQMGGSLADQLARPLNLGREQRKLLLMAGMSAGFGSVFGTPLAGAVFGMEVLAVGRLRYQALIPCLAAAWAGDRVALAWGITHTHYPLAQIPGLTVEGALAAGIAGILFGLIGRFFALASHGSGAAFQRAFHSPALRAAAGGALVALGAWALDSTRYLGLGLPTLVGAFETRLPAWDFAGKILFTVVTLGSGFKGGEVTPLFFIGATSGNALSHMLPLPFPLLAAMGFVAVFAGAANTPIACIALGIELFGPSFAAFAAIACGASYLVSGHAGIYRSQRTEAGKFFGMLRPTVRNSHQARRYEDLP